MDTVRFLGPASTPGINGRLWSCCGFPPPLFGHEGQRGRKASRWESPRGRRPGDARLPNGGDEQAVDFGVYPGLAAWALGACLLGKGGAVVRVLRQNDCRTQRRNSDPSISANQAEPGDTARPPAAVRSGRGGDLRSTIASCQSERQERKLAGAEFPRHKPVTAEAGRRNAFRFTAMLNCASSPPTTLYAHGGCGWSNRRKAS